jgi:hypothetical protein
MTISTAEVNLGINQWKEPLEKQGMSFEIPSSFLTPPNVPSEMIVRDEKVGLGIENDRLRTHLVTELSKCIRENKKCFFVNVDGDNLKAANNVNREFGDMLIINTAARTLSAIEKSNIKPSTKIIALREKDAADSVVVWFFDTSDQELADVRQQIELIQQPVKVDNPGFIFSISASVISSDDPRIQKELNDTKIWLQTKETNLAYDFYEHAVKDLADKDVKFKKIDKDMGRLSQLPVEELLTTDNMQLFINAITNTFGDTRISHKVLEVLLKLTSAQTALVLSKNQNSKDAYMKLLKDVGITDQQITTAKTTGDLLKIFQELFGSAE